MLVFSTGDPPTDYNLRRLDHLASDTCEGRPARIYDWLSAVIQSVTLLPRVAAQHFTGGYYIGEQLRLMGADARREKWSELVAELRGHVDAAHSDPRLRLDGPFGPPDVSGRPETLGERVCELVGQLRRANAGTLEFTRTLEHIESIAVGDVAYDVKQLRELLSCKRRDQDHDYWVVRHIGHMVLVADQQHHLAVR
jgi:hypothetical protein